MPELVFETVIDPKLPAVVRDAVSFETGATPEQVNSSEYVAYNHHGDGWEPTSKGALTAFYEDLIFGRPLPLKFATHSVNDIDTVLAVGLFMHRDMALAPGCLSFVTAADFVHRWGLPGFAHVPEDVGRFLYFLRGYTLEPGLTQRETANRLSQAITWVREYLQEDRLPHMPNAQVDVTIIDRGTNGFVFASTEGDLLTGWVNLYRMGYLGGVLVGPDTNHRRHVVGARKTPHVALDLHRAAQHFNELENAYGEPAGWHVEEDLLFGPTDGTIIPPSQLIEVMIRV
jgi:hypothetical protein